MSSITSWPVCRQSFDCILIALAGSGPDNSAIRLPGIEGSAAQIGGQLPRAGIAFSFLEPVILFQLWGVSGEDILISNGT
ncbi:MAG: hypothetical protein KKA54_15680 [Proteobacteria bacterium]|nr:hypothetical protein [Pseudomonadota bacterium]